MIELSVSPELAWTIIVGVILVSFAAGGLYVSMRNLASDLRKHMADEVRYREKNDERWRTHERGHA